MMMKKKEEEEEKMKWGYNTGMHIKTE